MTNNENDTLALQLFETVRQKQKVVASAKKPYYVTSCSFGKNPDNVNDRINIRTITDIDKLVEIWSFVDTRNEAWVRAIGQLNLIRPFKWLGYSSDEWKQDISTRIQDIDYAAQKKQLATLETKLNSLISPEKQRQLELEAIAKELMK